VKRMNIARLGIVAQYLPRSSTVVVMCDIDKTSTQSNELLRSSKAYRCEMLYVSQLVSALPVIKRNHVIRSVAVASGGPKRL
jgi:hypothetical protein